MQFDGTFSIKAPNILFCILVSAKLEKCLPQNISFLLLEAHFWTWSLPFLYGKKQHAGWKLFHCPYIFLCVLNFKFSVEKEKMMEKKWASFNHLLPRSCRQGNRLQSGQKEVPSKGSVKGKRMQNN